MQNPWLNLNPLVSVWLRNSNAAPDSERAHAASHARLQAMVGVRLRNRHKDLPYFLTG
jgi:hypothetical protein